MDLVAHLSACTGTDGLATTAQLRSAGASSASLTRAVAQGEVLRVRPGVYGLTPLGPWPRRPTQEGALTVPARRLIRAELLARDGRAVAAGRTAALLRGWALLEDPSCVELTVPHGSRVGSHQAQVTRTRNVRRDAVCPGGSAPFPVPVALDLVVQLVARLPLMEAVVVLDSALRSREVDQEQVAEVLRSLPGRRGAARARQVVALADPEAGSVLESVTRVHLLLNGFTGFATQRVIRHRGRRIHRVDFRFERQRLVVEVDGRRWHADKKRDQLIDNALVAAGWRVLRYGWGEIVHETERVLAELRDALAGQVFHPTA